MILFEKADPKTREVTLHGGYKLLITQKPSHDPTKSSSEAEVETESLRRPSLAPTSMMERLERLRDIVKQKITASTIDPLKQECKFNNLGEEKVAKIIDSEREDFYLKNMNFS